MDTFFVKIGGTFFWKFAFAVITHTMGLLATWSHFETVRNIRARAPTFVFPLAKLQSPGLWQSWHVEIRGCVWRNFVKNNITIQLSAHSRSWYFFTQAQRKRTFFLRHNGGGKHINRKSEQILMLNIVLWYLNAKI